MSKYLFLLDRVHYFACNTLILPFWSVFYKEKLRFTAVLHDHKWNSNMSFLMQVTILKYILISLLYLLSEGFMRCSLSFQELFDDICTVKHNPICWPLNGSTGAAGVKSLAPQPLSGCNEERMCVSFTFFTQMYPALPGDWTGNPSVPRLLL